MILMADRAPVVQLCNVSKSYGLERAALGPLSLEVFQGELLVVVGPSGCGKTTLLRLIAGLERPDAGEILLHGKTVAGDKTWVAPEDRSAGMVFQDYSLFPHLTVEQNVWFGLRRSPQSSEIRHAEELLQLLGLVELRARYPHQLSGGEQQRVAVARALAHKPDIILFDEPFSNLDAYLRPRMRRELKKVLRQLGSAALFVTHDQIEALELADRVAVLRQGQLEQVEAPEKIYRSPTTRFVAEFVGDADFLSGTVKDGILFTVLGELRLPSWLIAHPALQQAGGLQVEVMIRLQDIELRILEDAGEQDARGRIVLRQFRGSEVLYTVRLSNGSELRAQQTSDVPYPEGTQVDIQLRSFPSLFYLGKRVS
jgi:iron(III) transport system ATP-binding protein